MAGLYHDKGCVEQCSLRLHEPEDSVNQVLARIARVADENDARRLRVADEHELAEVLVLSQEDALISGGLSDQCLVD